ncbi:hypothetical protein [Hungatella hathewayi]|nr:hypothetical protein [Hungatella hathewayi]
MAERMGRRRDLREGERRRSRVRRVSLILAVTAMMAGGGISCVLVFGLPAPVQARVDILPDRNAMDGSLHAADGTALEEGQYRVVVNQLPTMKEGSQECNLEFENPPENRYGSRINLYLKSTGGRIGGTRLVPPGKYVEMITLNQALEPGEHPVLAKLELFDERKPAGEMTLELTVRVIPE